MMKIGVTGANGFIGWHLCKTLELNPDKFELIKFNRLWFSNESFLDQFVSQCDIIVHLAGINRHPDDNTIYNENLLLAKSLIQAFIRTDYKGQLLFSSSIQEERDNSFGNAKRAARELFTSWSNETGANFKGLVIPNVFGPFGVPNYNSVISTFCHKLVNNEVPQIENDATLNLIYIDDLIKKIIALFNDGSESYIRVPHTNTFRVSELLKMLYEFNNKYVVNGQIPNLTDRFEFNLFNTFRSYINIASYYPRYYKKNSDNRGVFVELIRLEIGGQVSFSTTVPGITRGNHFHTRKIERFSVIKGNALIQLRKIGTSEIFDFYMSGNEPSYVDMPIWYTHSIQNIGIEELYTIFWINEHYDINDPDTYFENVIID